MSKDPSEMTPEEYRAWNAERWRVITELKQQRNAQLGEDEGISAVAIERLAHIDKRRV